MGVGVRECEREIGREGETESPTRLLRLFSVLVIRLKHCWHIVSGGKPFQLCFSPNVKAD